MVLLENSGIDCDLLTVDYSDDSASKGNPHMILRVKCDGRWVYVDPTACEINKEFHNINYLFFEKHYTPAMNTSFSDNQ